MLQRLLSKRRIIRLLKLCFVASALLVLSAQLFAQQPGQKTFTSPEEASNALYAAVRSRDQAAILDIFGPDGDGVISALDGVLDENAQDHFVSRYREAHGLAKDESGTVTLYIGVDDWPFPVPLVGEGVVWHFDTDAGKQEVLYRRVGENQRAAINVCHALVDAENDYYSQSRDGRVKQYAQTLTSDEGQHNGLFWRTADGEPESPIGPLLANAEGVRGDNPQGERSPFHGYYLRILTGQGGTAGDNARSYIRNGEMTAGFAILAYPVEYGSSGVMTFIVNQNGLVYQNDLGEETTKVASAIEEYAPDESWKTAE